MLASSRRHGRSRIIPPIQGSLALSGALLPPQYLHHPSARSHSPLDNPLWPKIWTRCFCRRWICSSGASAASSLSFAATSPPRASTPTCPSRLGYRSSRAACPASPATHAPSTTSSSCVRHKSPTDSSGSIYLTISPRIQARRHLRADRATCASSPKQHGRSDARD